MSKKLILNWLVNKGSRERELSREGQYFSYFFFSSFLYSERNSLLSVEKYYFCHRARIANHMFKLPRSLLPSFRPLHAPPHPAPDQHSLLSEWSHSLKDDFLKCGLVPGYYCTSQGGGGPIICMYGRQKIGSPVLMSLSPPPPPNTTIEKFGLVAIWFVCVDGDDFFLYMPPPNLTPFMIYIYPPKLGALSQKSVFWLEPI